jgi:hypothetical protein
MGKSLSRGVLREEVEYEREEAYAIVFPRPSASFSEGSMLLKSGDERIGNIQGITVVTITVWKLCSMVVMYS